MVNVAVDVVNEMEELKRGVVVSDIFDAEGTKVATTSSVFELEGDEKKTLNMSVEIELFQNGKSLGVQRLADQPDMIYKWATDYADGKIEARGTKGGKKIRESLETLGEATSIRLTPDRTSMSANNTDVLHVVAQLVDAKGREIKNQDEKITFEIEGKHRFLGTDCGDTRKLDGFKSHTVETALGQALLAVQATYESGEIVVSARDASGKLITKTY